MSQLTLVPAYGRDYTSKADVKADWEAGKDFRLPGGSYINKPDFIKYGPGMGHTAVRIRYAKLTRVVEGLA